MEHPVAERFDLARCEGPCKHTVTFENQGQVVRFLKSSNWVRRGEDWWCPVCANGDGFVARAQSRFAASTEPREAFMAKFKSRAFQPGRRPEHR